MSKILVVGAGISGLTTALCLHQAGQSIHVVDGAQHIGGRVRSLMRAGSTEYLGDLGPSWVWPQWQPDVARWMSRLSLTSFAQFDEGDAIFEGAATPPQRHLIPGQVGTARLLGGPEAIISALMTRLPENTVQTQMCVTEIQARPDRLTAVFADSVEQSYSHIVLACPPRIIAQSIKIEGLPDSVAQTLADTPTWMAQQAKLVATYPSPFWREAGLSGRVASQKGPMVEIHDHSPADAAFGALFGFVGVDAAQRRADPENLRRSVLEQLSRCFGSQAGQPEDLVIQDWAAEPLICSARDLSQPPRHPEIGPALLRAGHLGGRLWFAASECAATSPGLIEGAFVAGEYAAHRLLDVKPG